MSTAEIMDIDRGYAVMATLWTESAVAALVVLMRFYARAQIQKVGWDDWLMFITLALFFACAALATLQSSVGGYRHAQFLSTDRLSYAREINFYLRAANVLSFATGKAAVGGFILRVMSPQYKWQKWVVWTIIILTAILNVLTCIFTFVQCVPVEANWKPDVPHECWGERTQLYFAYFTAGENLAADVVLAAIPTTFIWKLRMSRKRRTYLSVLLGLGSMATVCGAVKITELYSIAGDVYDFTWDEFNLTLWSLSETFVVIFVGCLPTLIPLWDNMMARKTNSYSYYPYTDPASIQYWNMYNGGDSDYLPAQWQAPQTFTLTTRTDRMPYADGGIYEYQSSRAVETTTHITINCNAWPAQHPL